jgi:thiol-disulfide isomerase/thioredoxin
VNDLLSALMNADATDLVGKAAPDLRLATLDGKEVRPADHKEKRVVVLYLWASWCAPSTADMPVLNQFVQNYEKKGASFLAINVEEKPEVVKPVVEKHGYKGTVALDTRGVSLEAYRLTAIPAVVLIGKDGTIQAIHTGAGAQMREKVQQDLDTLLKGDRLAPPEEKK